MNVAQAPDQSQSLDDWLDWISNRHSLSMDFTLDRSHTVAERLGVLKIAPSVITVGGTNGKGSTVRLLSAALIDQGIKTGAITSPHLLHFNERIHINDKPLEDAEIIAGLAGVEAARGEITLTYYEYAVLASFWLLKRAKVEVAILEVGLGGRLDTVNLIDATVAVITSIGIDHTEILGHDREAIGAEKAGIFRPNQITVLGDRQPPASMLAHAAALGVRPHCVGADFGRKFRQDTGKITDHQKAWDFIHLGCKVLPQKPTALAIENVETALAVLHYAFPEFSLERAYKIMQTVTLLGRMSCHKDNIWLDVAHNPDAAQHLAKTLGSRLGSHRLNCLYATLKDKDVLAFVRALQPLVDSWYLGATTGERGCSAAELAHRMQTLAELKIHAVDENFPNLCETAIINKSSNEVLLICGSFACVEQAVNYLNIAQ